MWGNLHLKSGLAAARAGNRDLADSHLAEATETAQRIGQDRDDYRLCFGPTNVNIWSVGLAVEMLDGTEAVKRSETFTIPATAPRERVGHHLIDLARGWLIHGDKKKAFAALRQAKEIAPTQNPLPPHGPRNYPRPRPPRNSHQRHHPRIRHLVWNQQLRPCLTWIR